MKNFKPYPEYKDTGVDWLDKVPAHWELRKLRTVLKPKNVRNQPTLPLLSVVREKGIIKRDVTSKDENHNYIPDDLSNYKVVRSGQFAMNKMKAWQGSYGISQYDGIVSPAYFVFELNEIEPDFFHIAIRSKAYVPFFTQASDGVRVGQWDLSQTRMKEIPFAIPSSHEQDKIAKFIKSQTIKIARFIKTKRRMIEVLKEQKQEIINKAVTKGLDPNVKLKPSGVNYLGDIPEHWEVRRLRFLIKGKLKYGANSSGVDYNPDLLRYIRITDFSKDGNLNEENKISLDVENATEYLLNEGDLLFARSGATVGKVFKCNKLSEPSCFAGYLIKAVPNKEIILSNFLFMYTQSLVFEKWKNSIFIKATIENISADKYAQLWVTLPKIEEQQKILSFIENETTIIDTAIDRANREIKLIREYRTRLISDVVTGKIDVRNIEIEPVEDIEQIEDLEDIDQNEELTELQDVKEADD